MYKTFSNLGQFLQTVIYLDLASHLMEKLTLCGESDFITINNRQTYAVFYVMLGPGREDKAIF